MRAVNAMRVVGLLAVLGAPACSGSTSSHVAAFDAGDGGPIGDASPDATADTGSDAPASCPTASFVSPAPNATLTVADDKDKDCSNGFQTDVVVATTAVNGTTAKLFANNTVVGTTTVSGATARFSKVQLDAAGTSALSVQISADANCKTSASVKVACSNVTCTIAQPTITDTHPMLNGVAAPVGDRTSASGSAYQVSFEVDTNAPDGSTVLLKIDNGTQSVAASASGGKAVFAGATLVPDGDHTAVATCNSGTEVGTSAVVTYAVDTQAPDLAIQGIVDGQFFGPADDVDLSTSVVDFKVCGATTSADAIDLPSTLGSGQKNFCVAIGTATPTCAAATTGGAQSGNGACIQITCPGGAPFDLNIAFQDGAGNVTSSTVKSVACASKLPSVQIVDPVASTTGDVTTNVLSATASQARKDQDAANAGAQYTVVACTDAAGGSGRLLAGPMGGAATQIGTATAQTAQASDNCPAGLGNVLRFTNVTLPESAEDGTGTLTTATELTVEVTDTATAKNTSPAVDVWVDSVNPSLGVFLPQDLCGKQYLGTVAVQQNISLTTSTVPVTLVVANGASQSYTATTTSGGLASFTGVTFTPGSNVATASATEPSGNAGSLPSACTVTVGNNPVVTWQTPTAGTALNAATDTDPTTAGWQGILQVKVDATSGTVTFTDSTNNLNVVATIQANGIASATVSVPDASSLTLTATTSDIAGRGVGSASLNGVLVDTVAPDAPTNLVAAVLDRRQTSFHLTWMAPGDGTNRVASYDVRVANFALTGANFGTGTKIAFTGSPAAPGSADSINVSDRLIETDYWFGVKAIDSAGNPGLPLIVGPARATFNTTLLTAGSSGDSGRFVDGSGNFNGDAYGDLLVGSSNGNSVWLYFGGTNGYSTTPNVTFTGTANTLFGISVANLGDIDSDGMSDIGIGAALDGGAGKVYVFRGRTTWPTTLSVAQADYVIGVEPTAQSKFTGSEFGITLARLGDFNGDGVDDFAVGANRYDTNHGFAAVIYGVPSGQTFPKAVTLPTDYGTRALGIEGEALSGAFFGQSIVGLGHLYSGSGTTMVVAGQGTSKLYAFAGQSGSVISASAATNTYSGTAGSNTGYSLSMAGMLSGNPILGVGAPTLAGTTGKGLLFFGNATSGVFGAATSTFTDSLATTARDDFGVAVIGSGFSGTNTSLSFIGSAQPDVVFSSTTEAGAVPAKLYFVRGEQLTTSLDVATKADLVYNKLPSDWAGTSFRSGAVSDLNGDGYTDLAIGEFKFAAGYQGRVLVLW